jgi:hypothetical protein
MTVPSGLATAMDLQSPTTPAPEQYLTMRKFSGDSSVITEGAQSAVLAQGVINRINQKPASELIKELQLLVKDARNNRGKILKSLEDLAIYFATEAFNEEKHQFSSASVGGKTLSTTMSTFYSQIIFLFDLDERKIVPYVHCFLSDINLSEEDKTSLIMLLRKEYTKPSLYQRAYAIRSIDRLCRSNTTQAEFNTLLELISDIMKNFGQSESIASKRNLKSLLGVTDKEKMEKLFLLRSGLQVMKNYANDPRVYQTFMSAIYNAARNRDPETARDAIALLSVIFVKNPGQLGSFAPLLPTFSIPKNTPSSTTTSPLSSSGSGSIYAQFDTSKYNQNDLKKNTLLPCTNPENHFTRFYLARLCSLAIEPPRTTDISEEQQDMEEEQTENFKYRETLNYLLHDDELMIFFEAIKTASNRNFEYFIDKDVHQQNQMILDYVVTRLCGSLRKGKPQIQLHAACRAAYHLSNSFATYLTRITSDPYSTRNDLPIIKNIMNRLYQRVEEGGLGYDCGFVRIAAFKCLLWREDTLETIIDRIKMEVRNNVAWMPFHLHELLQTLLTFARVQPRVFQYFDELCSFMCISTPERVDMDLLIDLFKTLVPIKAIPKDQNDVTSSFLTMIFRILDQTSSNSKHAMQLILRLYSFLGEYCNRIYDEPATVEKNVLDTNYDPELKKLKPTDIFQRDEPWDIMVAGVKAIVLRLMHSTLYSSQQVRVTCVEALAKIAFRSLDPIRLYIYQFLSQLISQEDFGITAKCIGIVQVLDELYALQQHFIKITTTNDNISDLTLVEFFDNHERVKEKISFYCKFAPSFLPLGLSTKSYLAKGFNVKKKMSTLEL